MLGNTEVALLQISTAASSAPESGSSLMGNWRQVPGSLQRGWGVVQRLSLWGHSRRQLPHHLCRVRKPRRSAPQQREAPAGWVGGVSGGVRSQKESCQ